MKRSREEMARLGTDAVLNRGKSPELYAVELERLRIALLDEAWIMAAVAALGGLPQTALADLHSPYVQLGDKDVYVPTIYGDGTSSSTLFPRAIYAKNLKPNRGIDSPEIKKGRIQIFPAQGESPTLVTVLHEIPTRGAGGRLLPNAAAKAAQLAKIVSADPAKIRFRP